MDKEAKMFHLIKKFKTFIEEKYKSGLAPRRANYETLGVDALLLLKVQQQDEVEFT